MNIVTLLAAAASQYAGSGNVEVRATLEPPVIPYHRQAQYRLSAEAPTGDQVTFPDMSKKVGGLGIAGVPNRHEETIPGNRVRSTITYVLDPIWAGDYLIAADAIYAGDAAPITVPPVVLHVRDLTPDESAAAMQFADIAGPIAPKNAWISRRGLAILLAALGAAAAVALTYFYFRKSKTPAPASSIPAWEKAYARLRALDDQHLPQAGQYEEYYVELSDILRTYIEDRFELRAPERTTPEFLQEAHGSGRLTDAHENALAGFMRHCDRVKFAQFEPSVADMDRSLTLVLQFVDETVPKPEVEKEVAA